MYYMRSLLIYIVAEMICQSQLLVRIVNFNWDGIVETDNTTSVNLEAFKSLRMATGILLM